MQIGHTLQLSIMSPLRLAHPMAELYSHPVSKQRKTIYFDDLLMTIAHHEKRCFFLGMLFLFPQRPTKGSVWWKQSSGLGATFSIFFCSPLTKMYELLWGKKAVHLCSHPRGEEFKSPKENFLWSPSCRVASETRGSHSKEKHQMQNNPTLNMIIPKFWF